jgi:hypothetical protein
MFPVLLPSITIKTTGISIKSLLKKLRLLPIVLVGVYAVACCAQTPAPSPIYDLTPVLTQDTFWSLDKDKGLPGALNGGPFAWTTQEKTEIRGASQPMMFQGLPVVETIFRFREAKLSEVFLSLYNRGDAGNLPQKAFFNLINQTEQVLNSQTGVQGQDVGDETNSTKFRKQIKIWLSPKVSYRLETALSEVPDGQNDNLLGRPEYVNLTMFPGGLSQDDVAVHRQAGAEFIDFDKRVQHPAGGDVVITSVPMVDQGQKGYCAVCTMERILRYYGCEVNEYELAQQANSSGKGGTDPESLVKAMRAMARTVDLHLNEFRKVDSNYYLTMMDDYNTVARRLKAPEVFLQPGMNSVNDIFQQMDVDILRKWKLRTTDQEEAYFNYIQDSINKGWPLAWSVYLGWVQEKPALPPGHGGHMRVIIGYNPDTREVLYSDSWGYGHEQKRMALDDAYIISQDLYVLEPKL